MALPSTNPRPEHAQADPNRFRGRGTANLTFKWTAEGNFPMSIVTGGTTYTLYQDPHGRLVRLDVNGAAYRYFLWSGDQLYAEFDSAGTRLTQYSWYPGLDRLHQFANGATIYNASSDALGNVMALTTSSGLHRSYQGSGGTVRAGLTWMA